MQEMNIVKKIGDVRFIGELTNDNFLSYSDVSDLAGIVVGTLANEGSGWLQFFFKGNKLIVAKRNARHSVSWDQLDTAGVLKGDKVVEVLGKQYKLRVLRGRNDDTSSSSITSGNYHVVTRNSEWDRLFYPIVRDDIYVPIPPRDPKAPYTGAELEMAGSSRFSWCLEQQGSNVDQRLLRGYSACSALQTHSRTNTASYCGWRPCLELIG